ncbi:MAG: hypothetical protein L0241_03765, partial [Planctomycetia bacterium]|nr:hypothetical protein [Planctomycetia bacterium]
MHSSETRREPRLNALECESLEDRALPATAVLAAGVLTVTGDPDDDRIRIFADGANLRILDETVEIGAFASGAVTSIVVNGGTGNDAIIIDPVITQPTTIDGDGGDNKLVAGGGPTTLLAGAGNDAFFGGPSADTFNADGGFNDLYKVMPTDTVVPNPGDQLLVALPPGAAAPTVQETITAVEVDILLQRAAAASASSDAIIAIVDRNGRILGVRVEGGVSPAITGSVGNLV